MSSEINNDSLLQVIEKTYLVLKLQFFQRIMASETKKKKLETPLLLKIIFLVSKFV